MKTILVTGRNGFIGSELVQELKKDCKIVSAIRRKRNDIDYSGEELIVGDLCQLKPENTGDKKIDLIVHLAAQMRGKPREIEENNIKSLERILSVSGACKVPILFLSSTNIFFKDQLGAYAQSKRKCEKLLEKEGVQYLIVRVPLVVGQSSSSVKAVKKFYKRFSFFPLFGCQNGKSQPIPVDSLVRELKSKIQGNDFSNSSINIVGEKSYPYREIIEGIIGGKKKARFIQFPFQLSLGICRLIEKMNLLFFVSSEEIKSVNLDKVVEADQEGGMVIFPNDKELLFG